MEARRRGRRDPRKWIERVLWLGGDRGLSENDLLDLADGAGIGRGPVAWELVRMRSEHKVTREDLSDGTRRWRLVT